LQELQREEFRSVKSETQALKSSESKDPKKLKIDRFMAVSEWKQPILKDPILGQRGNCPATNKLPLTGVGFKRSKHYANPLALSQLKHSEFFAMSPPSTKVSLAHSQSTQFLPP